MALTPGLAELGKISGDWLEGFLAKQQASEQPIVDVLAAEATSSSSSSQVKDGHQASIAKFHPLIIISHLSAAIPPIVAWILSPEIPSLPP